MFTEQSLQLPDAGGNITAEKWEIPCREDHKHKNFEATLDERYKKAERAICRGLMES